MNIADAATIDAVDEKARALDAQIEKLANFIIEEIPGEPSQSEGAVDTVIRWMRAALSPAAVAPGVGELREALKQAEAAMREYHRYWTGGETRGSYDGKPERNQLWKAMYAATAALSASPVQEGK